MKKKLAVMVAGIMACMTVMTGCGTDKTGDTGETGKKSEGSVSYTHLDVYKRQHVHLS